MNAGVLMTRREKPHSDRIGVPKAKLDGPTPEQLAKGDYARKFTLHTDAEQRATEAMTHISRHDPVERWIASERLSDGQIAAIQLCRRLWNLAGIQQRVTASYGERVPQGAGVEHRAISMIEARKDLHRIQEYIPKAYWQLFQNVVRFGEAAEIAGERLNFGKRSAADRAHQTVCFVADIVAMNERL